jgi:hypothetical protein
MASDLRNRALPATKKDRRSAEKKKMEMRFHSRKQLKVNASLKKKNVMEKRRFTKNSG